MAAGNALHCICMALLPELSVTPKLIPQFPSSFGTALGGSLLSLSLAWPSQLLSIWNSCRLRIGAAVKPTGAKPMK